MITTNFIVHFQLKFCVWISVVYSAMLNIGKMYATG